MVKYWNRLVNMSQSRLTSTLFHWDYEKSVYNNKWCVELRVLLQDDNMNQIFIEKVTGNLDLLTESCRVRDNSELLIAIQRKPQLQTFVLFKDNINIEHYLCHA